MSHSINWDLLEDQYLSDGVYREKLSKMVTIVDEAFLAGKKFARNYTRYSQIDNAQPNIIDPTKNLDITYKESNEIIHATKLVQVPKNIADTESKKQSIEKITNSQVPNKVVTESIAQKERLENDLKRLLNENKINLALYEKLTSNEKFVLDSTDIDNINKITEERIKEVLLKCKVGM